MKQLKRKTSDFIVTARKRTKLTPVLSWLLDFLNADRSKPPGPETFFEPISAAEKKQIMEQWLQSFEALADLQRHLIKLLAPLAEPRPRAKRALQCLERLIGEINRRGLRTGFRLLNGVIHQDIFPADKNAADAMVTGVYSNIAETLVSGELELLRRCPYCGKFFVALEDRRARFCRGHARLYYDAPSIAKDRVYKSRTKHSS